jgi:hypothetical protein
MLKTGILEEKRLAITEKECDCCHKKVGYNDALEWQEFHHIDIIGGYGSIFGDESEIQCDLCQHCMKKLLGDYLRVGPDWLEKEIRSWKRS